MVRKKIYSVFQFIGLTIFCLLPFYPILVTDERVIVFRDALRSFYPSRFYLSSMWHQFHEIPLWKYYSLGGNPYFADMSFGYLHPLNLIFLMVPPKSAHYGFSWYLALHIPIIFWGSYLLLKKINPQCAILGGITLCFSGMAISSITTPGYTASMGALPLFLYFLYRYKEEKNIYLLMVASFFLDLPLLSGSADFTIYFALISLTILNPFKKSEFFSLCLLALSAFAVSAVALLPFYEMIAGSEKGISSDDYKRVSFFSFHPLRMTEFFYSLPFGNPTDEARYWGRRYITGPFIFPLIPSFNLGSLPLVLSLGIFGFKRSRSKVKKDWVLIVIFAIFLVLSFGAFLPIEMSPKVAALIPGYSSFRYPEKLTCFAAFFLVYFLFKNSNEVLSEFELFKASKPSLTEIIRKNSLLITFILLELFFVVISFIINTNEMATFREAVLNGMIFQTLLAMVLYLFLGSTINSKIFFALVFLVSSTEMLLHAREILWDQPKSILVSRLANDINFDLAKRDQNIKTGEAYRYSSILGSQEEYESPFSPDDLDNIGKISWVASQKLAPSVSALHGINEVSVYNGLYPKWKLQWWKSVTKKSDLLALRLMGVYYYTTATRDRKVVLNKNLEALSYVSSPSKLLNAASFEDALEKIKNDTFNPTSEAVTEGVPDTNNLGNAKFEIVEKTGRSFRIKLQRESSKPIFLSWNESYDHHWKLTNSKGFDYPIYRVNGWAMGALIGEGQNESEEYFEFQYSNPLIKIGFVITSLWFCLFFIAIYFKKTKYFSL